LSQWRDVGNLPALGQAVGKRPTVITLWIGTSDMLKSEFPWITLIQLDGNYGFAYAVNRGIEASRGEHVALLNDDTEVDQDWLLELARGLESDREVGSVASKMLNFSDRTLVDAAGDELTRSGTPMSRGHGEPDGDVFTKPTYVFGACAGAALYRRSCLDQVGLLDEGFATHFRKQGIILSHFEDVDLAYRLQLAGYRCLYVPTAICYHKRGATVSSRTPYVVQVMERNLVNLYAKNTPLALLLGISPIIVAARARHFVRAVGSRRGSAVIRGFLQGIGQLPSSLRKRREIQRKRKVPAFYLRQFMRRNP